MPSTPKTLAGKEFGSKLLQSGCEMKANARNSLNQAESWV
jgi:hypothetical protein